MVLIKSVYCCWWCCNEARGCGNCCKKVADACKSCLVNNYGCKKVANLFEKFSLCLVRVALGISSSAGITDTGSDKKRKNGVRADTNEGENGVRADTNEGENGVRADTNEGENGVRADTNEGENGARADTNEGENGETNERVGADKRENKKRGISINNNEVSGVDTVILASVILCYGLLISLSAYTVFILDVTHSCTQDGEISCFPRFVKDDDPENPNITEEEMSARIMDCSQWTNDSKIRFECFRFSYNGQAALTTIGGLYAVSTLAVRIAITVFLIVFQCLKKCCKKCCKKCQEKIIVTGIQIICLVILLIAVGVGAFVSLSFEINALFDMDMGLADVFGFRLMIAMATMTLMLLLSWNKYADDVQQELEGESQTQGDSPRTVTPGDSPPDPGDSPSTEETQV